MDQQPLRTRRPETLSAGAIQIDFGAVHREDVGALLGQIELLLERPVELRVLDADAGTMLTDAVSRALTGEASPPVYRASRPRLPGYVFA